jgi:hypothetical protein
VTRAQPAALARDNPDTWLINPKEDKTMLRNVSRLKGFTIRARDGKMAIVDYFYFDALLSGKNSIIACNYLSSRK